MFLKEPKLESVLLSIDKLAISETDCLLLLIGTESPVSLKTLVKELNQKKIHFVGGVFPRLIQNDQVFSNGIIIKIIKEKPISLYFNSPQSFASQFSDYLNYTFSTVYTLLSVPPSDIADHLSMLYTYLGNNTKFIGGGVAYFNEFAGNNEVLICNDGVFEQGTIVLLSRNQIKTHALHGGKKLGDPLIVTKTEKNLILELNWENAFSVYQRHLKKFTGISVDQKNFADIAPGFPFGIYKDEREYIVRDPITVTPQGFIKCVGSTPENSLVNLLYADKEAMKNIPKVLVNNLSTNDPLDFLIFYCVSRANHLKENFKIELNDLISEIRKKKYALTIEGALSVGEIYSGGDSYLELLNKSVVLACLISTQ